MLFWMKLPRMRAAGSTKVPKATSSPSMVAHLPLLPHSAVCVLPTAGEPLHGALSHDQPAHKNTRNSSDVAAKHAYHILQRAADQTHSLAKQLMTRIVSCAPHTCCRAQLREEAKLSAVAMKLTLCRQAATLAAWTTRHDSSNSSGTWMHHEQGADHRCLHLRSVAHVNDASTDGT